MENTTNNTLGKANNTVRNITFFGLVVNLVISAVKFAIGVIASSQACVADAVHSLSDCITDIAVIVGVRFWSESADARHPHGHRRIETLITLFIGVGLAVVAYMLGLKAVHSIIHGEATQHPGWAVFAAAVISIVMKELLYQMTVRAGRRENSQALLANAWHHRSDALSSIPVAVSVILAKIYPGIKYVDSCTAILIAIMLLRAAWEIAAPALRELADEGASPEFISKLTELANSVPGVREITDIRTRREGSSYTLDLHILVDGDMSVVDGHRICEEVGALIQRRMPNVTDVISHMEPFAAKPLEDRVREIACGVEGVMQVHRIRLRHVISGYDADLHILVSPEITVREGHAICGKVKARIIGANIGIIDVLAHLEPYDGE